MKSGWSGLWLGLGLAASMTVSAHGGESHAWENTTLKPETRKKIEEGATQYRSCLNEKSKPLLAEPGDSRQQTDRVLKECESSLVAVKQAFRMEKIPEPLSDRYMRRLRTQGGRDVLQALMYAEAQRSVPTVADSKAVENDAVKPSASAIAAQVAATEVTDSPSSEVDRLAGLIPSAADFSRMPESLDRLHLILGGGLFVSVLAMMVMVLMRKPPSSDSLMPPITRPAVSDQPAVPASHVTEVIPDAAVQLLSLLQRDARFVDFVQEDMASFGDAEIGAVARVVHEGCRKVIRQHFSLEPVMHEAEGQLVNLEKGFDAMRIHITGRVLGEPPFRGTLVHRGWRVESVALPAAAKLHDNMLVAAAEVEL